MTVSLKFSEKKYCLRILHPSTTANHCVSPHLTNIVKNYPVIITYDELRSISSYFQSLLTPYDVLIALCFLKHSSFVLLVYKSAHTHTHTHTQNNLLTYSMVQSPSWEANWFVASQEIPRISWNPKVHYRTHKGPPPLPILGQPNPVHRPISHLLEIHPNIIHPSTPRSPQWSHKTTEDIFIESWKYSYFPRIFV